MARLCFIRWRTVAFMTVFVTTTLLTYNILSRVRHVLGHPELEELPGQLQPRNIDTGNLGYAAVANSLVSSNRKWDDALKSGQNHPDKSSHPKYPSGAHREHRRCNTTVTILIPTLYPFKSWREYLPFWKEIMRHSTVPAGTGLRTFHLQCPKQLCDVNIQVTTEEPYLNTTDAIVVNMFPNSLKDQLLDLLSHLRQVLHPHVRWFFYGMESPQMMTYWDPHISDIRYHYSITYHTKADIRLPYGEYLPVRTSETGAAAQDWSANKTALIAWMASNCKNTFWPRNEFVQELNRHVPVDIYGECGNLTCLPALSERCTRLMAGYKFYLSLENAECDEYITEKVWSNGLLQGVVPIVYGGRKEVYERLLPPKSFIHVGDFNSIQSLASYLRILDTNKSMYNVYHAWRQQGRVTTVYPPLDSKVFCQVVPFILNPLPPYKMVRNSEYYRGCRGLQGTFAEEGSLRTFKPWR